MTDTPLSDDVVLPCPFCGGNACGPTFEYELGRWDIWQIECPDCTISLESPSGFTGTAAKQAVVERWNTRALLSSIGASQP